LTAAFVRPRRLLRLAALAGAAAVTAAAAPPARAQQPPAAPAPPAPPPAAPEPAVDLAAPSPPSAAEPDEAPEEVADYTPAPTAAGPSALQVTGYVDVGLAKAEGNGTSFLPGDERLPADYGVDTFATAVNSRGDVASTNSGGLFENGFLPYSVGIGGRPSFLLNVLDVDLKYTTPGAPVMVFARVLGLPRFSDAGTATRVVVDQAFGRVIPFKSVELALTVGKFDSVFGIEYNDNPSTIRIGVTPSLIARYTTGTSLGGKVFFRQQIAPAWSAVSVNVAATTSGNMVESLQDPDKSLTGEPVISGRLGYELNLPQTQVKVGGSALRGPRNDQQDPAAKQVMLGADLRVVRGGFGLAAEIVRVDEDRGSAEGKITGLGMFPIASGFHARGGYAQASYGLPWSTGALHKVTPYLRYELRHAWFEGFVPLTVDRLTAGLRVDLWETVILKGEVLLNGELSGAPAVANNVYTSSVVWSW
jgi:hypothetical protein